MPDHPAPFDVDRLVSLRRVSSVAPSPDGTWLAVAASRLSGDGGKYVSDLWKVSLTDSDAAPAQLTRGASNDTTPRFRRDGSLGFCSDRVDTSGDETVDPDDKRAQVWVLPADGGEPHRLTDEPLGVMDFRFAKHGDRMVVIAPVLLGVPHDEQRARARDRSKSGPSALHYKAQPVRLWDHWIAIEAPHVIAYDHAGGDRRDLTPDADHEHREPHFDVEWDLSASGDRVVVTDARSGADRLPDHGLRIIDVASGASTVIDPPPTTQFQGPVLSPDGRRVACVRGTRSATECGKAELLVYDLDTATARTLGTEWDRWPVPAGWTNDGRAIICTADDRATEPVVSIDAETGAVTRITAETAGGCHGSLALTPDGRTVVGVRHRVLHPPEPFRVDLAPEAEPVLLASLSGFTPDEGAAIAEWERIETTAQDGTVIETLFVKPTGASGPLPALLWIHGGPIGQHIDGWHWRWNPLIAISDGYAVALPNPRGSTGYGQAMVEGIWNNAWGAECYTDLMSVTDDLERRPEVDASRIAAMGGSFGGYMANWIGVQTDRFRCLVTHASLYFLTSFTGTTDFPGWMPLEFGGVSPYTDPETFDRYSPHRYVEQWTTPTLILHGEKDYRVPISEALCLFEALLAHEVEAELVVFPDENHWIQKPRNVRAWYHAWQEFVGRYLGAPETVTGTRPMRQAASAGR